MLKKRWAAIRGVFRKETLGKDAVAGTVLGIESVPDGLANGLLAGVNPVAGLYAYLFGMTGAAVFTSSTFMTVQATGAMALVVSDTDLASRAEPGAALFTMAMLTGAVMILAGLLGAGKMLRFVPTAVMTGFVTAVGVNIVLGQLSNLTGIAGNGPNRLARSFDIAAHFWQIDLPTFAVGTVTIVLILTLRRTRLRSLGLVVAVVAGSVVAAILRWLSAPVAVVSDVAEVPSSLPTPVLPSTDDLVYLLIPAISLAFVGLVQGAAVSAGIPNPSGHKANASQDFIGQGFGNITAGVFQGMPVGGSLSASALIVAAGARTRLAIFIAAFVMGVVVLFASPLVSLVAMPTLAGLLIVVGVGAIKPTHIRSVLHTGPVQSVVMTVTFLLTLIIPLQFAVLVGVGMGMILFVAEQSNRLRVVQLTPDADRGLRESKPKRDVGSEEVVILQPYGSLFFASAPVFSAQLPKVDFRTWRSVVIIRFRGIDQIGLSHIDVLARYAHDLHQRDSRMMLVAATDRMRAQLASGGLVDALGKDAIYLGSEWQGAATRQAAKDAQEWITSLYGDTGPETVPGTETMPGTEPETIPGAGPETEPGKVRP